MMPVLFVSHGSPMTAIEDTPAHRFLAGLGAELPRPRAILVASAHWETAQPALNAVARNETIHDFYGFPPALSAISYMPPGAPELAGEIAGSLRAAGFAVTIDPARGLDHGAWVPLLLAWREADIPALQISVQTELGPRHHLAVGRVLDPSAPGTSSSSAVAALPTTSAASAAAGPASTHRKRRM